MTKTCRLLALPLVLAAAACGDNDEGAQEERKTAAGEVLGGTISDAMLPLDTVTSQGPPAREAGNGSPGSKPSGEPAGEPAGASTQNEDAAEAPAEPEAASSDE